MFRVFKITDAGGKTSSPDLLGLLFIETNEGLFLVDPESKHMNKPPRIMTSAILNRINPLDPPLAEFKFRLRELDWKVIVDHHHSTSELQGSWHNNLKDGAEDDHWVATGTGTGTDVPDDDEARAASATN
jgi:hypothetical protein